MLRTVQQTQLFCTQTQIASTLMYIHHKCWLEEYAVGLGIFDGWQIVHIPHKSCRLTADALILSFLKTIHPLIFPWLSLKESTF